MNLEILTEKENAVLKRKEITATVLFDGSTTPSKMQLQELAAKLLKADKDHVEIFKLSSDTGKMKGKAMIRIWNDKTFSYEKKAKEGEAPKEAPAKPKEEKEGE